MISNFVHSFEKLLRGQHLYLCRLISLHVHQEGKSKGIADEFLPVKYQQKSTVLRQSVDNMINVAEKKLIVRRTKNINK